MFEPETASGKPKLTIINFSRRTLAGFFRNYLNKNFFVMKIYGDYARIYFCRTSKNCTLLASVKR
jgi:CRISPR/Cas system-associated protein endoribonuclease Cas2